MPGSPAATRYRAEAWDSVYVSPGSLEPVTMIVDE